MDLKYWYWHKTKPTITFRSNINWSKFINMKYSRPYLKTCTQYPSDQWESRVECNILDTSWGPPCRRLLLRWEIIVIVNTVVRWLCELMGFNCPDVRFVWLTGFLNLHIFEGIELTCTYYTLYSITSYKAMANILFTFINIMWSMIECRIQAIVMCCYTAL